MSEAQTIETPEILETIPEADRPMLARTYQTIEIGADGRNVEMLCAPFDRPALVVDPPPHGDGIPYEEEFARGAFAGATKAPNRVLLEFEHWTPGLTGVIGHAAHLEERADALYGRFRMGRQVDGDKALELIAEGVLTAASVFFAPIKHARIGSKVRRLRVKLDRVSLCREGAYPEAQVLAVRSAPDIETVVVPAGPRLAFDPDLAEKLSAFGVAVPDGLRTPAQ